jgi:hypothetical protein
MHSKPLANTEGYISSFVEMFAWVMTLPAYEALWELLCPHINPFGWGYDFWYDGYAKSKVKGHKMGIVSTIETYHEQNVLIEGKGRTDNTDIKDKWNAVLLQEKYYKMYLHIDLKKIRKNIKISNSSWNGAVKGYLY